MRGPLVPTLATTAPQSDTSVGTETLACNGRAGQGADPWILGLRRRHRRAGNAADIGERGHVCLVAVRVTGLVRGLGGADVAARPTLGDPQGLLECGQRITGISALEQELTQRLVSGGSDRAGAGPGGAGPGRAGSGWSGRVGPGRIGLGRLGPGRVRPGRSW